ncbi:MAG: hypothetical protein JSS81_20515 [Acidobacteria bacterium]|nr:hypothetical protein [Acidobacteriota bacterium]
MKSKKIIVGWWLSIILAVGGLAVFGQENATSGVIGTDDGYLLAYNGLKTSFHIEFKGRDFEKKDSNHPAFWIDGKLIQVIPVTRGDFWKPQPDAKTEPTAEELLEAHRKWESDYIGGQLGIKLAVTSEYLEIGPQRKALFWSFPIPKDLGAPVSHQLFLTTTLGKDVLVLSAGPEKAEDFQAFKSYLLNSMKTLKTSEKPYDIKDLADKIKAGKPID